MNLLCACAAYCVHYLPQNTAFQKLYKNISAYIYLYINIYKTRYIAIYIYTSKDIYVYPLGICKIS